MPKKRIRVGVRGGQGLPSGYRWNIWFLTLAAEEARSFLSDEQYEHMTMQFRELASQEDPSHSHTVSVRKLTAEEFFELRDKGGVLGKINVRGFYGIDDARRSIVVLGAINKKTDGPTPRGTIITIRRRWRKYKAGEYGFPGP